MARPDEGPAPYGPLLVLGIVLLGLLLPWYFSDVEPLMEEAAQTLKLALVALPLLLLALISFCGGSNPLNVLLPSDPSSIHRVGGSPAGIALLLALVLAMVWYHSDVLDSWHPFARARY